MKRIFLITLLVCMVSVPAFAADTDSIMLRRMADNIGYGKLTWTNTAPVNIAIAGTTGTNTFAFSGTTEAVTVASGYGGTEACFTATISATGGTAVVGTVTWSSADLLTLNINGQAKTTDCTGVTLTACITAANALTFTYGEFTIAAGSTLPDTTYTNYYEPENCADLAATATTPSSPATVAQGSATLYDSSGSFDFTNQTIDYFNTTMEAAYGGGVFTVTIADGVNSDLANGMNNMAGIAATDMEGTGVNLPFDAGSAQVDYLEEDRFKTISHAVVSCNFGTACVLQIEDGGTVVYESAALSDNTKTVIDFNPPISAKASNYLKVQLYSADTISDTTYMYIIGSIY